VTQIATRPLQEWKEAIRRARRRATVEEKKKTPALQPHLKWRRKHRKLSPQSEERIKAFNKRHGILPKGKRVPFPFLTNAEHMQLSHSKQRKPTLPKLKFIEKSENE